MATRYILIAVVCSLAFLATAAQDACPGAVAPRLVIGEQGRVTPGDANNLRAEPSRSGKLVGKIAAGQVFTVLAGPVCANGFTWWKVESGTLSGWTVEGNSSDYFLEPLAGSEMRYEGISFLLPPDVASHAKGQFIQAVEPTEKEPWNHLPAYVEFTFEDYPDEEYHPKYDYPRVRVYEVTAFDGIDNMLGDTGRSAIEGLTDVLDERPDLYGFNVIDHRLPDDAPGAANVVLAQMAYLDFQNGSGYRYITAYSQNFSGPTNVGLMYRYLGLTEDARFFVTARFPINSPQLPEGFDPQTAGSDIFAAFQAYSLECAALFDSIPLEEYTPDLSQLDMLIASLLVVT